MPDLSALTPITGLRALDLKLNGTRGLHLLPAFTRLQYFEAWLVRGLTDLSPLAEVTSLEELKLESLRHVTALPTLHQLTRLRRITLNTMKGLTNRPDRVPTGPRPLSQRIPSSSLASMKRQISGYERVLARHRITTWPSRMGRDVG